LEAVEPWVRYIDTAFENTARVILAGVRVTRARTKPGVRNVLPIKVGIKTVPEKVVPVALKIVYAVSHCGVLSVEV
jgi:hypothetical protein